jgi:hypothetical protein
MLIFMRQMKTRSLQISSGHTSTQKLNFYIEDYPCQNTCISTKARPLLHVKVISVGKISSDTIPYMIP